MSEKKPDAKLQAAFDELDAVVQRNREEADYEAARIQEEINDDGTIKSSEIHDFKTLLGAYIDAGYINLDFYESLVGDTIADYQRKRRHEAEEDFLGNNLYQSDLNEIFEEDIVVNDHSAIYIDLSKYEFESNISFIPVSELFVKHLNAYIHASFISGQKAYEYVHKHIDWDNPTHGLKLARQVAGDLQDDKSIFYHRSLLKEAVMTDSFETEKMLEPATVRDIYVYICNRISLTGDKPIKLR